MSGITRDTPWRHLGAAPYAVWRERILDAGGTPGVAERAVWEAFGDDSALALAFLKRESSYASDYDAIPESNRNPWNLQIIGVGLSFDSYVQAARAWIDRLYDPRYRQGIYTKTRTIADLIRVYAPASDGNDTDAYINGVVSLINRNGFEAPVTVPSSPPEELPMDPLAFGNVPHPFYQDRNISNSTAWDDLGKRGAKCVVWHRMYGTLWGTDGYFRGEASGKALTDYGVGVAATDGAGQAGVILRWNDPLGRRAPWASGPVNNPIGDGAKFVNLYGINAVNRDGVSIEISGNGGTALDAKARASVVALTAYWADQYGAVLAAKGKQFDWTTFPLIPSEDNRSFVCWHGEFYDGKRHSCPGAVVMAATNGMIAEIKAILKRYQTMTDAPVEPSEPVYAKPQPPAAGDTVVNGRYFMAHERTYTLVTDAVPRIYADPGSDPTGPKKQKGATVTSTHIVSDVGASADLTLVIDEPNGSRIPVSAVVS